MQFSQTKWTFKQNCVIPSLRVCGESSDLGTLRLMLGIATNLIDLASKFNGIVATSNSQQENISAKLLVSFSLIFPDNIHLDGFIKFVQAQNIN